MARHSRVNPLGLAGLLWLPWAIATGWVAVFASLANRWAPYKPSRKPHHLRRCRRHHLFLLLAKPGWWISKVVGRLAKACPICWVTDPCPEHWRHLHREPILTGHQRRLIKRVRRRLGLST